MASHVTYSHDRAPGGAAAWYVFRTADKDGQRDGPTVLLEYRTEAAARFAAYSLNKQRAKEVVR